MNPRVSYVVTLALIGVALFALYPVVVYVLSLPPLFGWEVRVRSVVSGPLLILVGANLIWLDHRSGIRYLAAVLMVIGIVLVLSIVAEMRAELNNGLFW